MLYSDSAGKVHSWECIQMSTTLVLTGLVILDIAFGGLRKNIKYQQIIHCTVYYTLFLESTIHQFGDRNTGDGHDDTLWRERNTLQTPIPSSYPPDTDYMVTGQ